MTVYSWTISCHHWSSSIHCPELLGNWKKTSLVFYYYKIKNLQFLHVLSYYEPYNFSIRPVETTTQFHYNLKITIITSLIHHSSSVYQSIWWQLEPSLLTVWLTKTFVLMWLWVWFRSIALCRDLSTCLKRNWRFVALIKFGRSFITMWDMETLI